MKTLVGLVMLGILCAASYSTHLYWTVTTLFGSGEMVIKDAVIAILGAFVFPIGIIHGFTIWF